MFIKKIDFGVAEMGGGRRILMPFGKLGNSYDFSERKYKQYKTVIYLMMFLYSFIILFSMWMVHSKIILHYQGTEIMVAGVVGIDFLKFIVLNLIFLYVPRIDAYKHPPPGDFQKKLANAYFGTTTYLSIILICILEFLVVGRSFYDLFGIIHAKPSDCLFILILHAVIYLVIYVQARRTYDYF